MKHVLKLFVLLATSLSFIAVQAQNDSIGKIELDKVTKYNPILTAAQKITTTPYLESVRMDPPTFSYSLPNFAYAVLPTYQPAKAIGIRTDGDQDLYGNYFKFGAGNYLTPYGEFQLHSVQDKKYSYGASGRHLSANAGKPENADFSDNNISIFGSKIGRRGGTLDGKLDYNRQVTRFYGYDHDSFQFEGNDIKQKFNEFEGKIVYDNTELKKKFNYSTGLEFYTFSNGYQRENDYAGSLHTQFNPRKRGTVDVNAMVDFTHIIEDAKSFNRTFVRISPSYIFDYKKVELEAGFKFAIMLDSLGDDPFFYPNIKASYFLVPEKVKAFAEVGGDYKKTSLRDLSYLNPFIDTIHDFVNTSNSIKLEAGLKGTFKKRFDYLLKFNLSSDNSLPLFVSDTSTLRKFNVVYDDVLTTGFHAGLGMRIDEKLFMQFATTLYNYSTQVEAQAWQLPAFDIDVNVRYTFAKKLDVRIQLYAIGERFQQDKSEANTTVTLNPFIDVNLHADYRYKENISFFLNVNNISNARYQRWYNYPSFGINALAGITFSL